MFIEIVFGEAEIDVYSEVYIFMVKTGCKLFSTLLELSNVVLETMNAKYFAAMLLFMLLLLLLLLLMYSPGYTAWSQDRSSDEVIGVLDDIFRRFDKVCDECSLLKVRCHSKISFKTAYNPACVLLHSNQACNFFLVLHASSLHCGGVDG